MENLTINAARGNTDKMGDNSYMGEPRTHSRQAIGNAARRDNWQTAQSHTHNYQDDAATIPGDPYCKGCSTKITTGMMFMYLCFIHAVCASCSTNVKHEENICPYCEANERKRRVCSTPVEPRNSLKLLTVQPNPVVNVPQSFEYPPLHPTPSVQSFTPTGSHTLPYEARTCWAAGNCVIVGGLNTLTLTSVNPSGKMVRHIIHSEMDTEHGKGTAESVLSGVCVINSVVKFLHIVCVGYGGWYDTMYNKIYLLVLDPSSRTLSMIHPLATLDVMNPVHVFSISRQLYGVLCMKRISEHRFTNGIIRILGLPALVLPQDTDPRSLQSTALWGRRSLLHLNLPKPHPQDTVAVTAHGLYCVLSCYRHEVRVYSGTMVYLYTVGEHRYPYSAGMLYIPRFIQITADHTLVISCLRGDVQCYKVDSQTGTLDVRSDKQGRVYEVYKSDPAGWREVKGKREEGSVHYSTMSATRRWVIEANRITLHVYDINT